MMTQKQAQSLGENLLARVSKKYPKVFTLRVHENLGWHYGIENEWMRVSPCYNGRAPYFVLFKPHTGRCGKVADSQSPIAAIKVAVETLEAETNATINFLVNVKASLKLK